MIPGAGERLRDRAQAAGQGDDPAPWRALSGWWPTAPSSASLLGPVATDQQAPLLEQIRQGGLEQAFIVSSPRLTPDIDARSGTTL